MTTDKKAKTIVAANWKMNGTAADSLKLLGELTPLLAGAQSEVMLFAPYLSIPALSVALAGSPLPVILGAQNCHWEAGGAYTGEVSVPMLLSAGVGAVLIGHSERRQLFGETDEAAAARLSAALAGGMRAILCVGETLSEREAGRTAEVCERQLTLGLANTPPEYLSQLAVAYEPVWAIGTGRTATPAMADEACGQIRAVVAALYGEAAAQALPVLYGGSMNGKNAAELLAMPHINGGLVGGASLNAQEFAAIVAAADSTKF